MSNNHSPETPLSVLSASLCKDDKVYTKHIDNLEKWYKLINAKLPEFCKEPADKSMVGLESWTAVELPDVTQRELVELVINYRRAGWDVQYGPGFSGDKPYIRLGIRDGTSKGW
jgi:hypothetical protein